MIKQKLWLLLLTIILIITTINIFPQPVTAPIANNQTEKITEIISKLEPEVQNNHQEILVSKNHLLSHIENLNFPRYTNSARFRTRKYITSQLKKYGWQPQLEKFTQGINIVAQKPGTDPDKILIAAHYDTVPSSPGADDNATGIAVVLEVARIFASIPTQKTLEIAFFDQEETGLLGSRAFVKQSQHLQNLQGAIILDMLGYACYTANCQQYPTGLTITPPSDKGNFLVVIGDTESLALLNSFNNSNPNLPPLLKLPIPLKGFLTPDTLRSDHAPFWFQGISAVLVTDTGNLRNPHYHQPSDIPKNIQQEFFIGAAQVVIDTIYSNI